MKKGTGRILHLTLKSVRILINYDKRRLIYAKILSFFALSCSRVRNGNSKDLRELWREGIYNH